MALKGALDAGACSVFDLGASTAFRKAHIPGSRWSIRPRLAAAARDAKGAIVLVADDADVACLAATELVEAGQKDMKLLDGGLATWNRAGYPLEPSPDTPPDAECIDYLFFVHDRHAGKRESMRQYLAWETNLVNQLDAQERASFRVNSPRA